MAAAGGGGGGGGPVEGQGRREEGDVVPLNAASWPAFFDADGRILREYHVRKSAFYLGVEEDVRRDVWKYLLAVYPFASSAAERTALVAEQRKEYKRLKTHWMEAEARQSDAALKQHSKIIDKDVARTDRGHPFYGGDDSPNLATLRGILMTHTVLDPELGYIQGMNDLLSPILFVMQDETEAFWCFASYMKRMRNNFIHITMHDGLQALQSLVKYVDAELHDHMQRCVPEGQDDWLFCYRWVLLDFKREFPLEAIFPLWERIWAQHATSHFHIFFGAGILQQYRTSLLAIAAPDELLKFLQGLSMRMSMGEGILAANKVLWRLRHDEFIPHELKALITPQEGASFVPPPRIGFVRQAKATPVGRRRSSYPSSIQRQRQRPAPAPVPVAPLQPSPLPAHNRQRQQPPPPPSWPAASTSTAPPATAPPPTTGFRRGASRTQRPRFLAQPEVQAVTGGLAAASLPLPAAVRGPPTRMPPPVPTARQHSPMPVAAAPAPVAAAGPAPLPAPPSHNPATAAAPPTPRVAFPTRHREPPAAAAAAAVVMGGPPSGAAAAPATGPAPAAAPPTSGFVSPARTAARPSYLSHARRSAVLAAQPAAWPQHNAHHQPQPPQPQWAAPQPGPGYYNHQHQQHQHHQQQQGRMAVRYDYSGQSAPAPAPAPAASWGWPAAGAAVAAPTASTTSAAHEQRQHQQQLQPHPYYSSLQQQHHQRQQQLTQQQQPPQQQQQGLGLGLTPTIVDFG